jgi:cytochrome P450
MLGVPSEDHPALKAWSDELAAFVGSARATPDKYERAARAANAGTASLRERKRRRGDAEELIVGENTVDQRAGLHH